MPSSESGCAGHYSFDLFLVENGRNQVCGHRLEMRRFHRITGPTLGKRTNGSCVTEQLGVRNFGVNDGEIAACLNIVDATATPAQVATNVSLELVWGDVFDLKDRRNLKCKFVGIDLVKRTVNDIDLNIDNRITAEHAVEHGFVDAFFDGRN